MRDLIILAGSVLFAAGAIMALGWFGVMAVGAVVILLAVFALEG